MRERFRLRRKSDGFVLCTDGEWRPIAELGILSGHAAKLYMSKGGAGGKAAALPFVTTIEPHEGL